MTAEPDEGKEKPTKETTDSIGYFKIYRYATPFEKFLIFLGFVCACIKATVHPVAVIVYSELVAMFVDRNYGIGTNSKTHLLPLFGGGKLLTNASKEENMAELYNDAIAYGILMGIVSAILFVSGVLSVDILNISALKQVTRMRMEYFESTVRQDVGWHDTANDQNFALRMTDNIEKIRDGISEKVAHFAYLVVGFVITVSISFAYGWKLTLAVSAYIPIIIVCNYYVTKYQSKLTSKEQDSYATAGSLVEETLGAIRTVVAFGGEANETKRYDDLLIPAKTASNRKGAFSGFGDGVLKGMLFVSSGGAFWFGVNLIIADRDKEEKEYTPAILMIAFFGILVGADYISKTSPFLESFATARACASSIFKVIDTTSKIDPMSSDGKILNYGLRGDIQFQDVFFKYPSREDVIVLRGLNITVREGETVALVGSSGCGKSTCIQLMQRFYDPVFGNILLDDLDIRKYNIGWLRSKIAVVGQEPVLFHATIGDNIRYGKTDASQKEIEDAAKAAGVHGFIIDLPESYNTLIAEKGTQLSGGQKQRIAIARALIQNPKILLLDEATSALDYHSERLVQEALESASKGRTTIVVSHRLSAIKGADRIVFIEQGKVAEEGSHDELMKLGAKYYAMVTTIESENQEDLEDNMEDIKEERKKSIGFEKNFDSFISNHNEKNLKHHRVSETPTAKDVQSPLENNNVEFMKTFMRIMKIARPEWCYLIFAAFCAGLYGCTQPMFAIIFGEFYASLALPDDDEVLRKTAMLSIVCLIIGIGACAVCFTQTYLFNSAGVWVTTRMRSSTFSSILSQEVAWFDEDKNSVGALSARLSADAASVQGSIGHPLSGIIQSLTNFVCSVSIAFYFCWQLALMCICTSPFMIGSIIFEAKFMTQTAIREKEILEEASRIATETITNIRTVAGLRREGPVIEEFRKEIHKVEKLIRQKLKYRGLVNSSGMSIMFFGYAATLCYGGVLTSQGVIPFQNIIKVSETLLYGLMIVAQALAFAPAFTAALISGHRLFEIIDRQPTIQSPPENKNAFSKANPFEGVVYNGIHFRYPTRPDVNILQGLDLEILKGKTVALVGASGCGKSTCIQLLQRYYDPNKGQILFDKDNIQKDMSLASLRSKLGIVSQEPSLFERTISENIAYGDQSRDVAQSEIIDVAKMANAHTFIMALPNGYETKLGGKGTQLSGGQKQRIAIARALVRNPKILLLDEATSALDLQSEKMVQSALDIACSGRTCIVIAHRLSTVQNADLICVVQNGRITERGNHSQLLAKDGFYAKLYKTQPNLNVN